jgi:hypothetical protein
MSKQIWGPLLSVVLFSSATALGQAARGSGSARTHFDDGLEHAARGDLTVALQEFEAAYALKPHYSVLYNIGQAHAALGQPVEAVRAFERHLLEGGKRISQERREQVRELIASNRAKLGQLRLVGMRDTTRVWVDGREIGRAALDEPVLLTAGNHVVLSSDGDGFPATQTALVAAATSTELSLPAKPPRTSEPAPPLASAQLRVVCDLPGVSVDVGGTVRGTTPMPAALTVPSGPLTVRFSRAGYRPVTHHVVASHHGPAVALCDQVAEQTLAPAAQATLVVRTVPYDAEIFVDGERFLGAALPYGPHVLEIQRHGFVTQRKAISLRPREVTTYQVTLAATAARQSAQNRARWRRQIAGYTTGAGGLALGFVGAALFGWNGSRYNAFNRERSRMSTGAGFQTVASIQRVDDVAVGCAALGVGLIATSAWLLLAEPTENP